jgi:hypothetical protein
MPRCFQVHASDNVATLLDDVENSSVEILGPAARELSIVATEPIKLGHKLALRKIAGGEAIVKYGEVIGEASRDIVPGEWVHLHNCVSRFDERSKTLDVQTGAVTDTKYE